MSSIFSLIGKHALVTGAGGYLGSAMAKALASAGATVHINARSAESCNVLIEDIRRDGGRADAAPFDVNNQQQVDAFFETRGEHPIDILVNNAGSSSSVRSIAHIPVDQWDDVLNINLRAVYRLCQEFLPSMIKKQDGTIITVSSMAALNPGLLGGAAYSAAKSGVTNLMGDINAEFSNQGIRATAIMPAEVDTDILTNRPLIPDKAARSTMMQPEDLAEVIYTCAALAKRTTVETIIMKPTIKRDLSADLQMAKEKIT